MGKIDYIQEVEKRKHDAIHEVEKFNPYHDRLGRFATADGSVYFTIRTKNPAHQHWADAAVRREKERHAARMAAAGPAPKKGLVKGLGEEHAKAIEKLVQENAPQEVKNLWNKYGDMVAVRDSNLIDRCAFHRAGEINVNIKKDSAPNKKDRVGAEHPAYEATLHESGHAVDWHIRRALDGKSSVEYNNGEFEASLKKEANDYFKAQQKKMAAEKGEKVSIADARAEVGNMTRRAGFVAAGDVSDMLEGATLGKFTGVAGHGKAYWTGRRTYYGRIEGKSVATEAFAEMFSASIANPASLKMIKEVFPKSYGVFLKMCEEASQ